MPTSRAPLVAIAAAVAALAVPAAAVAKPAAAPKLPGSWQKRFHVHSTKADPDHDGLANLTEFRGHTNPRKADTDRDGVPDASEDVDRDGLDAATEQRAGTDPGRRDTDRDHRPDGREDADRDGLDNLAEQDTANDPGDRDSDGDGVRDGAENAGQVVDVDGDVLTVRLAAGGKLLTAAVADDTSVDCSSADDLEASFDDDLFGSGADDDPGADDDDPGADDDASDDDPADEATAALADAGDGCANLDLAPGAWVHEAETSLDDDGALVFDSVVLVGDD
jgi:hypothetical protein